jgi:uncharacterized protein
MRAADFHVNLIGLSHNAHQFDYAFGDDFFSLYGRTLLDSGKFEATVMLDKRETLIEADFNIRGNARLVCDRSLEPFDLPMEIHRKVLFKYGEEQKELSEEIVLITREQVSLDVGQYLYELITVNLPMKRLHPRFREEEEKDDNDIRLVYSSAAGVSDKQEDDMIDPRWEKLKKLT